MMNDTLNPRERLHQEIEATHRAFHRLLDTIPDEAFPQPSNNPAWTIGQVFYHMSIAPRFMILDVQMISGRRWIYRLLPQLISKHVFNWLNIRVTRYGARNISRQFLSDEYDRAHTAVLQVLDTLSEGDFAKSMPYPDWDVLISGEVSMETLFGYIMRHFDSHAAQITGTLNRRKEAIHDHSTLN
jgi:hypothetical protein